MICWSYHFCLSCEACGSWDDELKGYLFPESEAGWLAAAFCMNCCGLRRPFFNAQTGVEFNCESNLKIPNISPIKSKFYVCMNLSEGLPSARPVPVIRRKSPTPGTWFSADLWPPAHCLCGQSGRQLYDAVSECESDASNKHSDIGAAACSESSHTHIISLITHTHTAAPV